MQSQLMLFFQLKIAKLLSILKLKSLLAKVQIQKHLKVLNSNAIFEAKNLDRY